MSIDNLPCTADRLLARRAVVQKYLRSTPPVGGGGAPAYADDPMLAAVLIDALIAEAGPAAGRGRLEPIARRHGMLRAREDGTVDRLLAEYGAMRLGVIAALDPAEDAGPPPRPTFRTPAGSIAANLREPVWADGERALRPEVSPAHPEAIDWIAAVPARIDDARAAPDLHVAIDRAAAAAAAAFNTERLRQRRAVMRGQDHEFRGCLNAIWLAACVQRQNGNSSSDLIERQTTRMRDALDRSRQVASRPAASTLRLEDLLAEDLVSACRQEAAAWNESHRTHPCSVLLPESCIERFDIERIREAVAALLASAARHAGTGSALQMGMTLFPVSVRITVQGEAFRGSPSSDPVRPPTDEGPLGWLVACQTAAAHGGRLSVEHHSSGIAFELTLAMPSRAAGPPPKPVRPC